MAFTYKPNYDRVGKFIGVIRGDGAAVPNDPGNLDWVEFLKWNTRPDPLDTSDKPVVFKTRRSLIDIYQDLGALTAGQKGAVWGDLGSGSPRKYLLTDGLNTAAIGALDWSATDSGAVGNALTAARMRIAAMYTQDHPDYLVHPAFDPSINVPGDQ